jgi:hypothetical protein
MQIPRVAKLDKNLKQRISEKCEWRVVVVFKIFIIQWNPLPLNDPEFKVFPYLMLNINEHK